MLVDIFDRWYRMASGSNLLLGRLRIYSLLRFAIRASANIVLPLYFALTAKNGRNRLRCYELEHGSDGVIVSLTTFPGRISTVWIAIESLLRQSVKPDAIILWLSASQFKSDSELPRSLKKLMQRGLRIELRDGDLRSHKKYYYANKEFPNATLVLADDDIFYPTTMLSDLLSGSRKYKGRVICRFAKRMVWAANGKMQPYISWQKENYGYPRSDIFFGSGGGVLIPPGAMHPDVLNERAFLENCPLADDIWLNAMCRLKSRVVISTSSPFSLLPVSGRDTTDLSSINNGQQLNDQQLRQVISYCEDVHGVNPFGLS